MALAPKLAPVPSKEMKVLLRVAPEVDADALAKALMAVPGVLVAIVKDAAWKEERDEPL